MATPVPDSLTASVEVQEGETSRDRLLPASYKSPSGEEIAFEFTAFTRSVDLRGTAFDFPGVNGSYVQRTGHRSHVYPMRCFFTGENHDLIASAFEAAVLEDDGVGRLSHPRHGELDVVPLGTVTRRDDLVRENNQSIVEVSFWTTLLSLFPLNSRSPRSQILEALGGFDAAAAQQFADSADLSSATTRAGVASTMRSYLDKTSASLGVASEATAEVRADFADQVSLVNESLDVLVGQPLVLARQVADVMSAPARAVSGIRSRLDGYRTMAESIFGSSQANGTTDGPAYGFGVGTSTSTARARVANDIRVADLFASASVAGSSRSVVEHRFRSKPEAILAAVDVVEQFDDFVTWRDGAFAGIGAIDTGEAYQALHAAVSLVSAYLVEVSFTLVPERVKVLDRARTIVDLAAELYGEVDARLDFLIESNNLTGSEILELPKGKAIAYYA